LFVGWFFGWWVGVSGWVAGGGGGARAGLRKPGQSRHDAEKPYPRQAGGRGGTQKKKLKNLGQNRGT